MKDLLVRYHLTYGEVLRLTEGHGASEIYERVCAIIQKEADTFQKLKQAEAAHKRVLAAARKETP